MSYFDFLILGFVIGFVGGIVFTLWVKHDKDDDDHDGGQRYQSPGSGKVQYGFQGRGEG